MAEARTAEGAEDKATAEVKEKPQRKRITRRQAVEEKARSYFDAMDRRDAAAMAAHWREDGVEDVVPVGLMRGREELREFFASMFAAMPDARTTVTRLVAAAGLAGRRVEADARGPGRLGVAFCPDL